MFKRKLNKRGIAGLDILLAVVTSLFLLGILVMSFVLTGDKIQATDSLKADYVGSLVNETFTLANGTANATSVAGLDSIALTNVVVTNVTDGLIINSGNYTVSGGSLTGTGLTFDDFIVNVSADYSYKDYSTAQRSINDTTQALNSTTDFFPVFIIFASLVVLVLLVVIIIRSVRGSGLAGGSA